MELKEVVYRYDKVKFLLLRDEQMSTLHIALKLECPCPCYFYFFATRFETNSLY